ncbi:MAG: hypothetical protein NWF05_08370 [Candidatus Bathyarchaeota archaeon]|nr:hypothetical protein [Candidatus Bathyarchaeota archaeon]
MHVEKARKEILLLLILAFSFAYRFLLMTWNIFPSGADMGLHQSVINSIMLGKTDFFWNNYHMGGGLSATNPGYHIFVVAVTEFTGVTDYMAQVIVVAFFSAMIALSAFLIVRWAWNESAAFIAAFLMAFSSGDISILNWGGYPNTIALMLMPVVFYLYLQRQRLSNGTFFSIISLLLGALFLTHLFSALVFVAIVICTLFICTIFSSKMKLSRPQLISWLLPVVFGFILVAPYIVGIEPLYFGSQGIITESVPEIKQALLETRMVPIEVIMLAIIPVFLFFVLSRSYRRKYLSVPAVFFAFWILIPILMTQSYQLGLYVDYERFGYFTYFPVIVCTALTIERAAHFTSKGITRIRVHLGKLRKRKTGRHLKLPIALPYNLEYSMVVLGLLFFSLIAMPIFAAPSAGFAETDFYQVITQPEYEAIQWIRSNTAPESVFVADANFGWWLSGFAQRPTLSAVDPQFLILSHEVEPAKVATNLLTSDYVIENGLVQFRDDASCLNAKHELSAKLDDLYFNYFFFEINDAENSIVYRNDGQLQQLGFEDIPITATQVMDSSNELSYSVKRENQFFSFTKEITIYQGVKFVEVAITLQNKTANVCFLWLHLPFQSRGSPMQYASSIGLVDNNMQSLNQIVFPEGQLGTTVLMQENPDFLELVYNFEGKVTVQTSFFVGASKLQPQQQSPTENNQKKYSASYLHRLIIENEASYLSKISDAPIVFFDYRSTIHDWNIAFVVAREPTAISRFLNNPVFSLVFKNSEVAIFKVGNIQK